MTDSFTCTACNATLTDTNGISSSDYYDSGEVSFVADRWAGAVIECDDYTPISPIIREEGNTETDVGKVPKPTPEAEEKARKLLMKFLGKRRFKKAEKSGFIDIASRLHDGRIYRIPFRGGRIQVEENGKRVEALCFLIRKDALPWGDVTLAKTLFAKYDEEKLLEVANHFGPDPTIFADEGYGECDAG